MFQQDVPGAELLEEPVQGRPFTQQERARGIEGDDGKRRQRVQDADSARSLMRAQPSVIRRPVIEWGAGEPTVGFDAELFSRRI